MTILEQILKDMFIEQELLEQLDEEQKQILFCKMREEQIRRYKLWDCNETFDNVKRSEPKIRFRVDERGVPIVQFLGDDQESNPEHLFVGRGAGSIAPAAASSSSNESDMSDPSVPAAPPATQPSHNDTLRLKIKREIDKNKEEEFLKQQLRMEAEQDAYDRLLEQESAMQTATGATPSGAVPTSAQPPPSSSDTTPAATVADSDPLRLRRAPDPSIEASAYLRKFSWEKQQNGTVPSTALSNAVANNSATPGPFPTNLPTGAAPLNSASDDSTSSGNSDRRKLRNQVAAERMHREIAEAQAREQSILDERKVLASRGQQDVARSTGAGDDLGMYDVVPQMTNGNQGDEEVENAWIEQEQRAREAELQIRSLARQAREKLRTQTWQATADNLESAMERLAGAVGSNSLPSGTKAQNLRQLASRPDKPASRSQVVEWFLRDERPRCVGLDRVTNRVALWFHGIISRLEAERLLRPHPRGAFLIRVSERIFGYTLSYKASTDRVKHFLIERRKEPQNGYQFLGSDIVVHATLHDLVAIHSKTPITTRDMEVLIKPVGQSNFPPDYRELFDRIDKS